MTAFDWMCGEQGGGSWAWDVYDVGRDISIAMVSYKHIVYKLCLCLFESRITSHMREMQTRGLCC